MERDVSAGNPGSTSSLTLNLDSRTATDFRAFVCKMHQSTSTGGLALEGKRALLFWMKVRELLEKDPGNHQELKALVTTLFPEVYLG